MTESYRRRFWRELRRGALEWPRDNVVLALLMTVVPLIFGSWGNWRLMVPALWPTIFGYGVLLGLYVLVRMCITPVRLDAIYQVQIAQLEDTVGKLTSDPSEPQRRERVKTLLSQLCQEYIEALKILSRDGSSTDRHTLQELKDRGLATAWVGIHEGLASNTNLIRLKDATGQDKEWELKLEYRRAIVDYLSKNPLV